jgi:hypothetical protein
LKIFEYVVYDNKFHTYWQLACVCPAWQEIVKDILSNRKKILLKPFDKGLARFYTADLLETGWESSYKDYLFIEYRPNLHFLRLNNESIFNVFNNVTHLVAHAHVSARFEQTLFILIQNNHLKLEYLHLDSSTHSAFNLFTVSESISTAIKSCKSLTRITFNGRNYPLHCLSYLGSLTHIAVILISPEFEDFVLPEEHKCKNFKILSAGDFSVFPNNSKYKLNTLHQVENLYITEELDRFYGLLGDVDLTKVKLLELSKSIYQCNSIHVSKSYTKKILN